MKNSIQLAILGMAIALSSCIKDKEKSVVKPIEPDAQVQTQVDDNNKLKEEDEAVNNELRDAIEKIGSISGARMAADTVKVWCGCSVDSVNIAAKEVTFVFDNKTYCGNPSRIRSGKIKVKLVKGQKWRDANAVLGITFQNFKVTRFDPGRSWTFNGYKTLENVYGTGLARYINFYAGVDSLSFRERARDIDVAFLPAQATIPFNFKYSIARKTVYYRKSKAGALRTFFKANGDTAAFGLTNLDSWGKNRFGNDFTNNFVTPLQSDEYCFFWRPNSGEYVHKSNGNTVSVTFGVDPDGMPRTGDCGYGWKLNWTTASGATGQKVYSY